VSTIKLSGLRRKARILERTKNMGIAMNKLEQMTNIRYFCTQIYLAWLL